MAIRDLQVGLAEIGRIRLGQRVPKRDGNGVRPDKLDTLKFTSAAEPLIIEIAALYGGTPAPFTGEGVRGKQFQVVTDINIIPVYVPRQKIDPFYEQWGGEVCTRRCDGERDTIHDRPCDCNPDKRACKPTTRVNLMLADVTGPGYWRLETHGIYAAMELSSLAMMLQAVRIPVPAKLLLEPRKRKFFNRDEGKVEVRDWFTPVVILDNITPRMLATGGDVLERAIEGASRPTEVQAVNAARAIEAAPTAPDPQVIERGLALIGSATPAQMADLRQRIVKMGSPQVLVEAFQARLTEHAVAEAQAAKELETSWAEGDEQAAAESDGAQGERPAAAAGATAVDVDATDVPAPPAEDEADRKRALMELLGVAGELKLNTKQLDDKIFARFVVERAAATAAQFRELAVSLRSDGQ